MYAPMAPSAAMRDAFLSAEAMPFLRSHTTASSRSPPHSPSAFLQSIMPAPDLSRSSLTCLAEIPAVDAAGAAASSFLGSSLAASAGAAAACEASENRGDAFGVVFVVRRR